jgi:hydrogenase maturation protease
MLAGSPREQGLLVKGTVLVAGIGNIFLSDDGFGPEVARRLGGRDLPDNVKVVDYGIRGMHLAYDLLEGYDGLVIVDALRRDGTPGDLVVLQVGPEDLGTADFDAHGMEPVSVLASLGSMGGELPPTYVIGCEPADLEEGIGLTPKVEAAIDPAIDAVIGVLTRELATSSTPTSPLTTKEQSP